MQNLIQQINERWSAGIKPVELRTTSASTAEVVLSDGPKLVLNDIDWGPHADRAKLIHLAKVIEACRWCSAREAVKLLTHADPSMSLSFPLMAQKRPKKRDGGPFDDLGD